MEDGEWIEEFVCDEEHAPTPVASPAETTPERPGEEATPGGAAEVPAGRAPAPADVEATSQPRAFAPKKPKAPAGPEPLLLRQLREAREAVHAKRGCGKEEATAAFHAAELAFTLSLMVEAQELANSAMQIYAEEKDFNGRLGQAESGRLLARCLLADDKVEEAVAMAERLLESFRTEGNRRAEALASLAVADALLAAERPKQALGAAEAALATFRSLEDDPWAASALQAVARSYLGFDKASCTRTALERYSEALELLQQVGDEKEQLSLMLVACKVQRETLQQNQDALDVAQDSLELSKKLGDRRNEAIAMREAASIYLAEQAEIPRALEYARKASEILQEIGDAAGEVTARQLAASLLQGHGRGDQAAQMLERALSLARERGDVQQIGAVLTAFVSFYAVDGQLERAIQVVQQEAELAASEGHHKREVAALQRLARLLMAPEVGNPELALEHLKTALRVAAGEKSLVASVLHLKAEVLQASGDLGEAIKAAGSAEVLLRRHGGVRALVSLLQLSADLYWQAGEDLLARDAYTAQRQAYQAVGWKDKEAMTLLTLADLCSRIQRPKEAKKMAQEAVDMQKALRDEEGQAHALVALAGFQGATTEATKTAETAYKLFQYAGDAAGQAQALQVMAGIFSENGNIDQALQKAQVAYQICQQASEAQGSADASQIVARLHASIIERCTSTGIKPTHTDLQGAIDAVMRLSEACEAIGDLGGRTAALNQASSWNLMKQDPNSAVRAAEQSLEAADQMGAQDLVAISSLTLAEAHLAAENGVRARQAADDALSVFEQLGDEGGCQEAQRIIEAAKALMARPKASKPSAPASPAAASVEPKWRPLGAKEPTLACRQPAPAAPETQPAPAAPAPQAAFAREEAASEDESGPATPAKGQLPERRARKAFSQKAAELPAEQQDPAKPSRQQWTIAKDSSGQPNQELRRHQLRNSTETKPLAFSQDHSLRKSFKDFRQEQLRKELHNSLRKSEPEPVVVKEPPLESLLKKVRPDWSDADLQSVQEKLGSIHITTPEGLFQQLRDWGCQGLNNKLKENGRKPLKHQTLKDILAVDAGAWDQS